MMVYLAALVLGVGFPVGIIYLIGLTKFKIEAVLMLKTNFSSCYWRYPVGG